MNKANKKFKTFISKKSIKESNNKHRATIDNNIQNKIPNSKIKED